MEEKTIDLRILWRVLKQHMVPIISVTIVTAMIGFVLAYFIIPKQYTSESLMYVENSANKNEDSSININDINVAQKLVNTCQILFTSNYMLNELSDSIGNAYTTGELSKMIKISSVNSTEILKISIISESPENSYKISKKFVELSQKEFMRVIKSGSIEVVSNPTTPVSHTYPSTTQFTLIGMLIGLAVSYIVCLIIEILDIRVKPDDDLAQLYGVPVFAEIMDFLSSDKSKYKYSKYSHYSNDKTGDKDSSSSDDVDED